MASSSPNRVVSPPPRISRHNSPRTIENSDSEYDLQHTRTWKEHRSESQHHERRSVFEDVTIPTNILRCASVDKEWAPKTEVAGPQDHHQADSSTQFGVVDIALEQHAVIDFALGNASTSQARRPSHTNSPWNHGQTVNWRQTSLSALDEEKKDEVLDRNEDRPLACKRLARFSAGQWMPDRDRTFRQLDRRWTIRFSFGR